MLPPTVLEQAPVAEAALSEIVLVVDASGAVLHSNTALDRILGHRVTPDTTLQFGDLLPATRAVTAEETLRALWATVAQGRTPRPLRVITASGETRIVAVRGGILPHHNSSKFVLLMVWQDITDRWEIEQELRLMHRVFENALEGVARLDAEGNFLQINRAYAEMLGYSPQELLGTNWEATVLPEDRPAMIDSYVKMLTEGKARFESRGVRKNGSLIFREMVIVSAHDRDGRFNGHHSFMRDITLRKEAEQALRRSRQQIRAHSFRLQEVREEERTRLARDLHDNLGQYLTGLKMELSALARRYGSDLAKRKRREFSDQVHEIDRLLDESIQLVRNIARELRPAILDHLGIVDALDAHLKEFATRSHLRVESHHRSPAPALDPAVSTQLFRIVQELLTNIARHARATRVTLATSCEENIFFVQVTDNGIGIKPEDLQRPDALGILGMKERAFLFRGSVHFSGKPGKGTTVTIQVPLQMDEPHLKKID